MEVAVHCCKPASQELSSNTASVMTLNILSHCNLGNLYTDDLKICLNEFLSTEKVGASTSCLLVGNCNKFDVMEDECKDSDETTDILPKSTSSVHQSYSPPKSSSTAFKLASAMKGSREKKGVLPEKLGVLPEKLSVTWAPDVYDPVPTSVSHFPTSKNQQYHNNGRKYGKNKQRSGGKSSRGGKGKDNKQGRKNGGNNTRTQA